MTTPFLTDVALKRLEDRYPELRDAACPTCKGKRVYTWKGQEVSCLCTEQRRLHTHYLNAGVGVTYQRLSWADVEINKDQLAPVIEWMDNAEAYIDRGVGLILHGDVGTGKTLLLNLIIKELVKQGYDCYSTTFSSTVEAFTAGWSSRDDSEWFAERFMRSRVLGLDDLGKEFWRANRLHSTTFDHILRTRVQAGRPTILTTNMNAQELLSGYGKAILSLLIESSIEVQLTGDDFRPKAKARHQEEVKNGERRPII